MIVACSHVPVDNLTTTPHGRSLGHSGRPTRMPTFAHELQVFFAGDAHAKQAPPCHPGHSDQAFPEFRGFVTVLMVYLLQGGRV